MGKAIDLTGSRFGRLVALRRVGGRVWAWRCDCGTASKEISAPDVTFGRTRSCGCLAREASRANGRASKDSLVIEMRGQRFGRLVVVARAGSNKHGSALWRCRCDCGGVRDVVGARLRGGNTASCGCAYAQRLVVRPQWARERSNAYVKGRAAVDPKFALSRRASGLVHASLKARGADKSRCWEGLVGYSLERLRRRLERTMPAGCSWDDFMAGRLHIDHIVPLAAFDFRSEQDPGFRRAWALRNLQLLPARENLAKGARR